MSVQVRIPTPLQKLTNHQEEVLVQADTINGLIEALEKNHPGIKERICDEKGQVRRFVNIFLNDEDIRFLEKEKTTVKDGDVVSIIPAIAGGSFSGTASPSEGLLRRIAGQS
ncbi:MAG: molybdopterin synthase sulfur carrier subunit [Candidatus Omnitrophica bacterium CG11_big_fil_rev_8_21_14_0_20_45_26]|uniref:Molybdopterin synthase sulfur carrier subunit n=1 Tax=Candidatus Abzuiibacterium crystallinum TaxID=1974748 RepID=A0A2H0LMV2_9BACT|nr:MAG: molybdopterin synthase sulfur carrier subunit [Candidatus Omnitrophica bacterium CG11_big_fil_rev_8_21_14_0_20_45_26]PIW64226.1 MAG: molybdopterin synthase sulfur carrier subunit [Candidatus Omnitrophica bacterium CG12_big_fil_rev_8_21_14_0_65_45_16]